MSFEKFACWSVLSTVLAAANASQADEVSVEFLDQTIADCIEFVERGETAAFDKNWRMSLQTKKDLEMAQSIPELPTPGRSFLSPEYNYYARLDSNLTKCGIAENHLKADENTDAPSTLEFDFEYEAAKQALEEWGGGFSDALGFVDWSDEVAKRFPNDDFVLYFKKRCGAKGLTAIEARAVSTERLLEGIKLPSFDLSVLYYPSDSTDWKSEVFDRGCKGNS